MNKENVPATPTFTRKRAKSFSTPPGSLRAPPLKQARGILKGNGDDAHTIAFIPIHSANKNVSASAEKRRKSMNRRVSFASHASVRLFEKVGASPEAPQTTPRRSPRRASPARSPIGRGADDSNDDLTMDLTSIIPPAQPAFVPGNSLAVNNKDLDAAFSDESDEEDDELAGQDDTAAMDLTDIVPSLARQPSHKMLDFASPARQQNPDDSAEESMDMTRALGQIHPVSANTQSPRKSISAILEQDLSMDMTRVVGGIVQQTAPVVEDDDSSEVSMEETRVFTAQLLEQSPAKTDVPSDHTVQTVATVEDDTQRVFVGEGSATEIDVPKTASPLRASAPQKALTPARSPGKLLVRSTPKKKTPVRPNKSPVKQTKLSAKSVMSPVKQLFGQEQGMGFNWGAQIAPASPMDVSMADASACEVIMDEEDVTMDMTTVLGSIDQSGPDASPDASMDETRVLGTTIHQRAPFEDSHGGETTEIDMSFTKVITQPVASPVAQTTIEKERPAPKTASPRKRYSLSSGAIRSPLLSNLSPTPAAISEPAASPKPSTPQRIPSRRGSLLDAPVPVFNSPSKVLLQSIDRPEFGKELIKTTDLRVSVLREKLAQLTPRKQAPQEVVTPKSVRALAPMATPATSKKTLSFSPFKTPLKTPSRLPASKAATPAQLEPLSPITLKAFLEMTGVSFLTGLSTTRRRETMLPKPAALPISPDDAEAAELEVKAAVMPVLEMYQHSCRELTRYISEGRHMCDEMEAAMNEENPDLFDAFRRATGQEKRELEGKFRDMKSAARLSARGVWYAWRTNLMMGVLQPLSSNLEDLERQAKALEAAEADIMPKHAAVEEAYNALKEQVEQLLREEDAYDASDVERAQQLVVENDEMARHVEEEKQLLEQLAEQEATLAAENEQLEQQLAQAEKQNAALEREAAQQRGFSLAELAELRRVLVESGRRSGWEVVQVTKDMMKLSLESSLAVVVPLHAEGVPELSLASPSADKQEVLLLTHHLRQLQTSLPSLEMPMKEMLAYIKGQWTAVRVLAEQVKFLSGAHPTTLHISDNGILRINTIVLLFASKTKFKVTFIAPSDLAGGHWDTTVEVVYGGLDCKAVQRTITGRVKNMAGGGKPAWLLESIKMPEGL
jgi:kinetochore protein Spc7/SPC105